MNESRQVATTSETMDLLGVSRATISNLIRRGDLEAYKLTPALNSSYRIYVDSIQSLLKRREQTRQTHLFGD